MKKPASDMRRVESMIPDTSFNQVSIEKIRKCNTLDLPYYSKSDIFTVIEPTEHGIFCDGSKLPQVLLKMMEENNRLDVFVELSIQTIFEAVSHGKMTLNIDGQNDKTQRNVVTTDAIASGINATILSGDPNIPEIQCILLRQKNGTYALFLNNGMQRTSSLVRFIRNELVIRDTGTCLDGHIYDELPEEYREIFKKRTLRFHVMSEAFASYRGCHFETLNTKHIKMSFGETVNAKYSRYPLIDEIRTALLDPAVQSMFMSSDSKKDLRLNAISEIAYAIGFHYVYWNPTLCSLTNRKNNKTAVLDALLETTAGYNCTGSVRDILSKLPEVCILMKRFFGSEMHKRTIFNKTSRTRERHTSCGDVFPSGYFPYAHTGAICSARCSILFSLTARLAPTLQLLDDDEIKEFAKRIDEFICSEDFEQYYNSHTNNKIVIERMTAVLNTVVNPFLKEKGYKALNVRTTI